MKKVQASGKLIAFPIQLFAEGDSVNFAKLTDELHVIPTGKWDHPAYGEMEITTADIAEFIANFKAKVRRDIPITAGHDTGMSGGELPAIGWFKDVFDRGVKGLYAVVEWTDEGKKLLEEGAYKYFSPEFYSDYEDPETREKYQNVLVGGALTNKPYFKELDPVSKVASFSEPNIMNQFNDNSMNIDDILKKVADKAELSAEEKAFVKTADLDDAQKETLKDVLADEGGEGDGEGEGSGEGDGEGNGEGEGEVDADGKKIAKEPKPAKKGMIQMSEVEAKALRDKADKGERAFAELETMRVAKSVEGMVFSETNKAGHLLPKQKDATVTFMKSLSEKQRDQFVNIINGMAKSEQIFDEKGDAGAATGAGVFAEIEAKVKEVIKASEGGKKLSYSQALKQVLKENPKLASEYNKEQSED